MKTDPLFDPSFQRALDANGAWLYSDPVVHSACLSWVMFHNFNLAELDNYLQEDGWDNPQAQANRSQLIKRRAQALQAHKDGNKDLAIAWLNYLALAMRAGKRMEFLLPLSRTGKKFVSGRKPGAAGPVRLAIRRYLKRQPQARAAQIWAALSAKPPKGMAFYDNRLGKYIETEGQPDTQYRQFANLVSMERRLLEPK